jgi:hypothetical protein
MNFSKVIWVTDLWIFAVYLPQNVRLVKMKKYTIFFILSLLLNSGNLHGEDLTGTIKDKATGNPIPNAVIWLENTNFRDTTDISGNYSIYNIPRGVYGVIIAAENYQTVATSDFPVDITGGIEKPQNDHLKFHLYQNYPNPFNPITTIKYSIQAPSNILLAIYDLSGKLIKILDQGKKIAGEYQVIWDGTDNNHQPVSTGIYFYTLRIGKMKYSRMMVFVK